MQFLEYAQSVGLVTIFYFFWLLDKEDTKIKKENGQLRSDLATLKAKCESMWDDAKRENLNRFETALKTPKEKPRIHKVYLFNGKKKKSGKLSPISRVKAEVRRAVREMNS